MVCLDKQDIKIQEIYSNDANTAVVDVELYGDFVGTVAPGDVVQIIGFIKAEQCSEGYKLKLECNNLYIMKNKHSLERESSTTWSNIPEQSHILLEIKKESSVDFCTMTDANFILDNNAGTVQQHCSEDDFQMFKQISNENDLISIFVTNLFPDIYGHCDVKAGLVLALFGGTKKFVGQCTIRSEIHVLIIGDPGLGKSKMLLSISGLLPKSTYVSGSFCTTAGLTVSITHDPATGEYMADAGALVISDGGICCIDEFDKIDDHNSMFEVMEGQQVTVAKGGVVISVPSRTSIIAASNPRYGHFDTKKSVRENLKFDSALLSRFDLIFIMLDNLTDQENQNISSEILRKRLGSEQKTVEEDKLGKLLKEYHSSTFIKPTDRKYSKEVLKKYIEYARNTIFPVLSSKAKDKLQEYYLSIKDNKHVSIRSLESLIRLTESCAKMELKSIAGLNHAIFAINLHKKITIKEEETKQVKGKKFDDLLKSYVEMYGNIITLEKLQELVQSSIPNKDFNQILDIYNIKGVIIKKSKNEYKIIIN